MSSNISPVDAGGPVATHNHVPEGSRREVPDLNSMRLQFPLYEASRNNYFMHLQALLHPARQELMLNPSMMAYQHLSVASSYAENGRPPPLSSMPPRKRPRMDEDLGSGEPTRQNVINYGQPSSSKLEPRLNYIQEQDKFCPKQSSDHQRHLPSLPPHPINLFQGGVPHTSTPNDSTSTSRLFPPTSVSSTLLQQPLPPFGPFSIPGTNIYNRFPLHTMKSVITSTVKRPKSSSGSDGEDDEHPNVTNSNVAIKTEEEENYDRHSKDVAESSSNGCIQVKKEFELCHTSEGPDTIVNTEGDQTGDEGKHFVDSSESSEQNDTADKSCEVSQESKNSSDEETILSCSLCEFKTADTLEYNEHLRTDHANVCFSCQFVADNPDHLAEHRYVCSGGEGGSGSSKPPSPQSKPKNKLKRLLCKLCQHLAQNDKDFYDHRRTHISPDKLLCCSFCHFVTQYKHHLDYHVKNHTGNKPFKCKMCSYTCVNKSMLNSHMKSHSNHYSFRCQSCNYECKYMHALKQHCRKFKHVPMPVLNPDGSTNPYPIVDVYGNKRGPKLRKDTEGNIIYPAHYTAKIAMQSNLSENSSTPSRDAPPPSTQAQVSPPISYSFPTNPLFQRDSPVGHLAYSAFTGLGTHLLGRGLTHPIFSTPPLAAARMPSFLNSPQTPSTPRNFIHEALLKNVNVVADLSEENSSFDLLNTKPSCHICKNTFETDDLLKSHFLYTHLLPNASEVDTPKRPAPTLPTENTEDAHLQFIAKIMLLNKARSDSEFAGFRPEHNVQQHDLPTTETTTPSENQQLNVTDENDVQLPLDLTKDHTPPQQIIRRRMSESPMDVSPSSLTPPDTCSPPLKPRRTDHHLLANRRLEKISEEVSSPANSGAMGTTETCATYGTQGKELLEIKTENCQKSLNSSPPPQALNCSYCQISFGFQDMHSKHMAFHDADDPLMCSFCKESYSDFSSFYDHCFGCKNRQLTLKA